MSTLLLPDDIPVAFVLVVGAATVILILAALRVRARRRASQARDPRRMYSAHDRQIGFERAGAQCEYARWFLWRCTRTAEHGDHFIPWSQGGATTMANFVASCPRCNTSKGAKMPALIDRVTLQSRRRGYFPHSVPRAAGQRFRQARA